MQLTEAKARAELTIQQLSRDNERLDKEVRRSKRDLFDLITNEQERKREGEENVGFERSSTDPGGQVGDKEGAKMGYGSIDSVQAISNLVYSAFYVYKH